MLIKSAVFSQISGSIGGMTGAHNAGGMYVRQRSIPTDPATVQQLALRNAMAQLTSRWGQTLTDDQRAAWATYAANVPLVNPLGDARSVPPLAMFVRSNLPRLQAGLDVVDDGPTVYALPSAASLAIAIDAGDQQVDVTFDDGEAWCDLDGAALLVYMSRAQAPTINFFKGPYRFAGAIEGDSVTPPTSPTSIALPFAVAAAQKGFALIRLSTADGRLSAPFRDGVTAA